RGSSASESLSEGAARLAFCPRPWNALPFARMTPYPLAMLERMTDRLEDEAGDGLPQAAPAPVLFEALLTPHRSLSPRGFVILMSAIASVAFLAGLTFFLLGAWPVIGFMGLEVLLVWVA